MLSDLTEKNDIFEDFRKCLDTSYEYTEACVSLMEVQLQRRGYKPLSNMKTEDTDAVLTNMCGKMLCYQQVKLMKICILGKQSV